MDASLQRVTREILTSYSQVGGLNNSDGPNMPSKLAVGTICEELLRLLFPGFHDDAAVHGHELAEITRSRIADIAERLDAEIFKSLRTTDSACKHEKARLILGRFLDALPGIRELLRTDIQAAYEGDPAAMSYEEIVLSYPFIETVAVHRMAHVLYNEKLPLLPRMMAEWAHSRSGIDIHPGATIGTHFFIDHGTGVVIGETCIIGNHVKLYHGVTLGARSFEKDDEGHIVKGGKRHPNVEEGTTIYPNSTILGGETVIGANSTIGANVFLLHSVPANSLVFFEEKQLKVLDKTRRKATNAKAEPVEWSI